MSRFYMPVEFYFGQNVLQYQGQKIAKFGKKCFLVTGHFSAYKSGALDDINAVLARMNIKSELYEGVNENPDLPMITEGAELMKKNNCDFVIGIGGGSPIDAAKAIAVLAKNEISPETIYQPNKYTDAFPIIAIPTTAGTGTEVTPYSVITNPETGLKAGFGSPYIFPKLSFLDPNYTKTMPFQVTRDTAVDALSHLLEGIYSQHRNPLNNPFIYKGIEFIYHNLKRCLKHPEDYSCRKQLMIASLYGGITIAQSGTTLQHSIGYPLTTNLGLSHGYANGIVIEPVMELYYSALQYQIDALFAYLKTTKSDFYKWLADFDFTLSHPITESFLEQHVSEVLHSKNMALNPINVSEEQIRKIYLNL